MAEGSSLELLARWRDEGDQQAAEELCGRYVGRLIALARSQMSPKLARRVDPDDVVQSVCRTFFVRVRDGRLELQPGGDLWQLLAAITMHKTFGQLEHHTAGKRSITREEDRTPEDSMCCVPVEAVARDPGPADVAAVDEEREKLLQPLSPLHRQMVELRLQEYTLAEIAAQTGRSERMVRIVLSGFGKQLKQRLLQTTGS